VSDYLIELATERIDEDVFVEYPNRTEPIARAAVSAILPAIAEYLEAEADNQNKLIASMAGVPYDPDRLDGSTAFGIRQAARLVRQILDA
jgi:hypothetical protein